MPKTGGTSFRNMIFRDAKKRGKTIQAHYYNEVSRVGGGHQFDAERPAQVIIGHFVNFHTLSGPVASGHSVRYATMVRSPVTWALSLYLHFHPKPSKVETKTQLDEKVVEFVQGLFTECKGLVRSSNGTECGSQLNRSQHGSQPQLYAWYSGGPTLAMPDKCESFASFFALEPPALGE